MPAGFATLSRRRQPEVQRVRGGGDDVLHPDAEERELKERKSYFIGVCGGKKQSVGE